MEGVKVKIILSGRKVIGGLGEGEAVYVLADQDRPRRHSYVVQRNGQSRPGGHEVHHQEDVDTVVADGPLLTGYGVEAVARALGRNRAEQDA